MKVPAAVLALMFFGFSCPLSFSRAESLPIRTEIEKEKGGKANTPPNESAERKAILNALRAEMKRLHHLDFIFTVNYLKVERGWAWIQAAPKSSDGTSNFESVSALMRKRAGRWKVAEMPCTEEGNPDCLGQPDFFKRLRARFPGAPMGIFPE